MEHAGTDLSEVLRKEKKLSEDRLVNYAKQILNAMLYLKDSRIMHRDLKPQNILLQKDTIKICDFGFAKKLSAST
jgi:serine/threonine protein kinase